MTSPSLGPSLGFAGLGQMGGPMAANIAAGWFPLIVYDKAGAAERAPRGAGKPADEKGASADAPAPCFNWGACRDSNPGPAD